MRWVLDVIEIAEIACGHVDTDLLHVIDDLAMLQSLL